MIAIYARQSIEKKDSVSIEAQIEKCKYFCDSDNYTIYKDSGYSGKNINRPQFTKLLEDIKAGHIKKVIAYRLDRISRSIADFSQLLIMFDEYDVKFVSATENFDTDTPMGRAMINIVMTFAQLERETIVERVTDNYYFRANNGYWAGGYAPYGYKIKHIIGNDNKKHSVLEIDEEQSKVVKRIFDMYINQDYSMRKISQILNLEKVPNQKNNGNWTINTISAIIRRPIYTNATAKIYDYYKNFFDGTYTANLFGKAKKNAKVKCRREFSEMYLSLIQCEPIISNEDWFKAQKISGIKKLMPPRSNTSKISFLCGLVKCGKCGSNLVTQGCKNRYGKQYYYLICNQKRNIGANACDNKMIFIPTLQNVVIEDMKEYFSSSKIKEKIEKYINNNKDKNIHLIKEKEDIENEILKIEIQINNLISALAEGSSTVSKYINDKIEQLENNKQQLVAKINQLESETDIIENSDIIKYIQNINEKLDINNFEEMKKICNILIDKIVITDENIDIHYKI